MYGSGQALQLTDDVFVREQLKNVTCVAIRKLMATALPQVDREVPENLRRRVPLQNKIRRKVIEAQRFFFEKNGLLMRRTTPVNVEGMTETEKQPEPESLGRRQRALQQTNPIGRIVVPSTLRPDVLVLWHGLPMSGHRGRDETTKAINL